MDKKFKFGGTIGYADSYLEFLFCRFKVSRLHAKPYDATGAVRAHSGEGSRLILHDWTKTKSVFAWSRYWTALLPSLKHFLPSILTSIDF